MVKLRQLAWAMIAAAWLAFPAASQTRLPTINDIVSLEAFGRADISPDGKWAIYERRGPYDTSARFDFGQRSTWTIMDLRLVDLENPGAGAERLLPEEGLGLLRGPWSPSGKRLVVYRLRRDTFELGIVTVADRSVRWTGITPEMLLMGATVEWRTDDQLAIVSRDDNVTPWLLRYYNQVQAITSRRWTDASLGAATTRTILDTDEGVATSEQGEPRQRLVLFNCQTGEATVLAQGHIIDFALSPGGDRVALIDGREWRALPRWDLLQSEVPMIQGLRLLDVDSGRNISLTSDFEVAPHLLRWSADGAALLVWGRGVGEAWKAGNLRIVSRDGVVENIDQGGIDASPPGRDVDQFAGVRADWLGSMPVLYGALGETGRRDWYALTPGERPRSLTVAMHQTPDRIAAASQEALYFVADGRIWRSRLDETVPLTEAGRGLKDVTPIDPEAAFRLRANDAPRRDWVAAVTADGHPYIPGIEPYPEPESAGSVRVLAARPDVALVLGRNGLAETLMLKSAGQDIRIDDVNIALRNVDLPSPSAVEHLDANGRPTRSWLFLPPGAPDRIKGLVVLVYPGSVNRGVWSNPLALTYGVRPALFVTEGYAVLSPSIPGADYGPDPAAHFTASVDGAVDAALLAHPSLPADRIAVAGHSFGGYAALGVATRSSRYRSYVAWSATSDLSGKWGELTPANRAAPEEGFMLMNQQGWAEAGQGKMGSPPFDQPGRYQEASPYLNAARVTAPVLLITSDLDFVPLSQSELMFSALSRLGRKSRLITYWGEEHFNWSPANIRDLYDQIFMWLDESLVDETLAGRTQASASTPVASPQMRRRE